MRTKTINVYTYSELSEKAKEYAIMTYGRFNDEEFLTEEMELQLHDAGFPDAKVNWSLSSCQGDGVCFMGEWHGEIKTNFASNRKKATHNAVEKLFKVIPQ